jgi:hypothetical protein
VLGSFYPGKMLDKPGTTEVYAVVQSDSQGKVATAKYTFGARKLQ